MKGAIEMSDKEKLIKILKQSNNIVFFGGAGVSVASGIPDFRGEKGLYKESPEEIISHHYFLKNTKEFYEFYFSKMVFPKALPNQCHMALAKLEEINKLKAIVTQNIDGLHQTAGSKMVLELHGSVKRNYCMKCHKFYEVEDIMQNSIPRCSCGGIIKPDVVLYEEALEEKTINQAIKAISEAETLIVAGTSLVVYPAASFIRFFKGKHLIVINVGSINCDMDIELAINGKVEEYLNLDIIKELQ